MNHKFKQWWYALHSGKPIKILFFIQKALGTVMPLPWYQYKKKNLLDCAKNRSDYGYIKERVDYYCKTEKRPYRYRRAGMAAALYKVCQYEKISSILGKSFIYLYKARG